MTEKELEATRRKYTDSLKTLFLPEDPLSNDIVNYFASLLRVVGMEDKGWDPYLESRSILEDLNAMSQTDLPGTKFPEKNLTMWRMGLLMYSHIALHHRIVPDVARPTHAAGDAMVGQEALEQLTRILTPLV